MVLIHWALVMLSAWCSGSAFKNKKWGLFTFHTLFGVFWLLAATNGR
jgi:hypothetical protein